MQQKTALLLDAGADHVFDAAIAQYKAMTSYLKWEDMGIITVPNMETKGSMTTAPNLAAVIRLGESLWFLKNNITSLRAIIKRLPAIFMLKTGRRQQCLAKPKNILLLPSARQTA